MLLLLSLVFFTELLPGSFFLALSALIIQLGGGAQTDLFYLYIPLLLLFKIKNIELKKWWLVIPLFSLFRNLTLLPYLILYGTVFVIDLLQRDKEKIIKKTEDPTVATDTDRKEIRKSISVARSFPVKMSRKFVDTLNSIITLSIDLFDPWSVILLLKDKETNTFSVRLGKSTGKINGNAKIKTGPLSWFYSNSGILVNNEFNSPSTNLGYYESDQFVKCFIASSIKVNNKNEGIIIVDRRERIPFTERDREILQAISETLSTLISLYRYMDASMLEASRFQALLNLTEKIAGEIKLEDVRNSIFKTIISSYRDAWSIFLLKEGDEYLITEQDGRRYKRPVKSSLISVALEKNISILKDNLEKEYKRPILLPEERDFNAKSLIFSTFRGNIEGGILLISEEASRFSQKDLSVLNLISDIAAAAIEKAVLYDREREKAIIDGLTEVYNHRFFQEIFDKEIAKAKRNDDYLSLLMIDIDDFKLFNDNYGHQTGDMILREIAGIMKKRLRSSDIISRYGGEEFTVLLPSTSPGKGYQTAENIREEIEGFVFKTDEGEILSVTVSIGVSGYPDHGKNKNKLINASDKALYSAKEKGKNRTELYE